MKTPFYIIERTPVTKETAMEKWRVTASGDNSLHIIIEDLIDFCMSGGTEEKVYIEVGTKVRIKSMPDGVFRYAFPGYGASCSVSEILYSVEGVLIKIHDEDWDHNTLEVTSEDLSEYLELV